MWGHWQQSSRNSRNTLDFQRTPTHWNRQLLQRKRKMTVVKSHQPVSIPIFLITLGVPKQGQCHLFICASPKGGSTYVLLVCPCDVCYICFCIHVFHTYFYKATYICLPIFLSVQSFPIIFIIISVSPSLSYLLIAHWSVDIPTAMC